MIRIARATQASSSVIADMEVDTKEFPLTYDQVKEYTTSRSRRAYVASIHGKIVGHVLITAWESDSYETGNDKLVSIDSLGVLPSFRGKGISYDLVHAARDKAIDYGTRNLIIIVPHYTIEDKDDPWNILGWLERMGFQYHRLFTDELVRYGKKYDAYIYLRKT